MKRKIIPILLAVTLLFSVMVIPSFASETTSNEVTNLTDTTWSINKGWTCTKAYGIFNIDFTRVVIGTVHSHNKFQIGYSGKSVSADNYLYFGGEQTGAVSNGGAVTITITGGSDVTNTDLISWLNTYATPVFCDGSTCPATDLNADSICDDCGSPLSLRLTGYPTLPDVSGSNMHSVVIQRDDGYLYMVLTSDTPYTVGGTVGDNFLITVANEQDVSFVAYKCTDGKNWVNSNSGEAYSLSVGETSSTLLASTFDWYKDGTIFFQVPLWEKVGTVTQGQIPMFSSRMGGNLMTLTLCGVGLITLLVALYLLLKMFKRYQH